MSSYEVKVTRFVCDVCGNTETNEDDDIVPVAWYTLVQQLTDDHQTTWDLCSEACLLKTVRHAIFLAVKEQQCQAEDKPAPIPA